MRKGILTLFPSEAPEALDVFVAANNAEYDVTALDARVPDVSAFCKSKQPSGLAVRAAKLRAASRCDDDYWLGGYAGI